MKIVSWNVNSVRSRLNLVTRFLEEFQPDVVLLQETKVEDHLFPQMVFEDFGYNVAVKGEKSYNGVAILSKSPLYLRTKPLEWKSARCLEVEIEDFIIMSLYAPNGFQVGSEKFQEKMDFYEKLEDHLVQAQAGQSKVIIGGDFNIAPYPDDVHEGWSNALLSTLQEQQALRRILHLGYYDALRMLYPDAKSMFTWWDYRQGSFAKNQGVRIDHFLLSSPACNALVAGGIVTDERQKSKPSDHAPVWIELDIAHTL